LALVSPCLCYLGAGTSLTALVLGFFSLRGIKQSNGQLQGSKFAYTGMKLSSLWLVFLAAVGVWVLTADPPEPRPNNPAVPRAVTASDLLDSAESQIISASSGVAHGNTPRARELALELSNNLKATRDRVFTEDQGGVSLSGGNFLVYCRLTPGKCAFLVHVPKYRKFSDEAKETLAEIAW
jgi:hypothetical protein